MKKSLSCSCGALLPFIAGLFCFSAFAGVTELSVDGYEGSEPLKGFALPVRISELSVPGFRYSDGDVVTFASTDGKAVYPSEVERWNPGGESLVWVRIPELKRGVKLRMAWGQDAVKTDARAVWADAADGFYAGVWHFGEASADGTTKAADSAKASAALILDAVPDGPGKKAMVAVDGIGGFARVLSGDAASFFTVPAYDVLQLGGRFTFSGWFKANDINPFKTIRLVTRSDQGYSSDSGWAIDIVSADALQVYGASNRIRVASANFKDNRWHHLAVIFDGCKVEAYTDGRLSPDVKGRFSHPAADNNRPLRFGFRLATPSNPITLRGAVDEFRLLSVPVSADWVKAEYDALAKPGFVLAKDAKAPVIPSAPEPPALLPVIPQVQSWKPGKGSFVANRLVVAHAGAEAQSVVALLNKDIKTMFDCDGTGEANVLLAIDNSVSGSPEGYLIDIGKTAIRITGASRSGLYWGTRTLLQLFDAAPDKRTIACGRIDDAPKYRVRGFVLDVARKYFPLSFLDDLVTVMSYYKMNDFHVHLNDNGFAVLYDGDWSKTYAAFRMECESYPGLTAKDGSYSKKDFRDFVKRAAGRGVKIVPEIDAPAHSMAFTRYRGDFAAKSLGPDHLDLHNPDVVPFFEKLYAEYLGGDDPVFAGPTVHVGTDEYSKKEAEVFRAFSDKLFGIVQSYGKEPRAWGALDHCRGTTKVRSEGVVLDIWYNPYYSPYSAIRAGYKVISIPDNELYICPATGYYNDYLNLTMVYKYWEPRYNGNAEFPADEPALLGGAFAVWNDHCGNGITSDDVYDRLFPAMQTMAEKLWRGRNPAQPFEKFLALADQTAEAPGVNLRDRVKTDAAGNVEVTAASAIGWSQQGGWTVSFDLFLDGEQPTDAAFFDDGYSLLSPNLSGTGKFGFRRDGYDCVFNCKLPVGKSVHVKMTGDPKGTSLYLDGIFVERLEKPRRKIEGARFTLAQMETLHFPLKTAKNFKGEIKNLKAKTGTE